MKVGSEEWFNLVDDAKQSFGSPLMTRVKVPVANVPMEKAEKPAAVVPEVSTTTVPIETKDNFTAIRDREQQRNPNLPSDPDAVPIFDYDLNKDMGFDNVGGRDKSMWHFLKPNYFRDDNSSDDELKLTVPQKIGSAIAAVGTGGVAAILGAGILPAAVAAYVGGKGAQYLLQPEQRVPIETSDQQTGGQGSGSGVPTSTTDYSASVSPHAEAARENRNSGGRDGSSADRGTGNRTTPNRTEIQRNPFDTQRGNTGGRDGSSADRGTGNRTSPTKKDDHASVPR